MKFEITYSGSTIIQDDEVWPDGDGPANPTAKDVIDAMKAAGSIFTVIHDWCLIDDVDLSVDGEPW